MTTSPASFAGNGRSAEDGESRTALRANRPTGRRFELARLLADRLLFEDGDQLRPATRAYTYRQKMQRAFAGEFLCPMESLVGQLDGDYSDDAREDAADRYRVSPLAVTTLLVNNGLIDRREIVDDGSQAAAPKPDGKPGG